MRRRAIHAACLAACLAASAPALAADDDGDASVRYAARFVAERGARALDRGELEEALRLFNVAEQLFHAPTLVLAIAQTEARMGRWAEARKHYQQVLGEDLPKNAPPPFRQAQKTAQEELAALDPRIPRLVLTVKGSDGPVEVRVDGKPVPVETIEAGLPVSPGRHDVVVVASGDVRVAEVKVAPKERRDVVIDFDAADAHGSFYSSRDAREATIDGWWPATAYGVGVAGLTLGTVTGVLALNDAAALRDRCQQGTLGCDPAARSFEDSARTLGVVSTVGFIVGGLGVATGTALLIIDRASGGDEVALRIGPGSLGLQGRF